MSEDLFEKAKAAASSVTEKINNLKENIWDDEKAEIINQFKDKAEGKLNEVIETINRYKSLFTEAGYDIQGLNASLSIPPDISLTFAFLDAVDRALRVDILSRASESKLATIMLKSLFKASDFAETIKVGQMKLKSIDITLGLIPGISITIS
jgi:hypothetical protein